jgi:hypothetical protein
MNARMTSYYFWWGYDSARSPLVPWLTKAKGCWIKRAAKDKRKMVVNVRKTMRPFKAFPLERPKKCVKWRIQGLFPETPPSATDQHIGWQIQRRPESSGGPVRQRPNVVLPQWLPAGSLLRLAVHKFNYFIVNQAMTQFGRRSSCLCRWKMVWSMRRLAESFINESDRTTLKETGA